MNCKCPCRRGSRLLEKSTSTPSSAAGHDSGLVRSNGTTCNATSNDEGPVLPAGSACYVMHHGTPFTCACTDLPTYLFGAEGLQVGLLRRGVKGRPHGGESRLRQTGNHLLPDATGRPRHKHASQICHHFSQRENVADYAVQCFDVSVLQLPSPNCSMDEWEVTMAGEARALMCFALSSDRQGLDRACKTLAKTQAWMYRTGYVW